MNTIIINGQELPIKANALLPRLYRRNFGRDIYADLTALERANKKLGEGETLSQLDLEIFENICWLMLKQGGNEVGSNPDEWLDTIDGVFSVYEALPQIVEAWRQSEKTTAIPAKK